MSPSRHVSPSEPAQSSQPQTHPIPKKNDFDDPVEVAVCCGSLSGRPPRRRRFRKIRESISTTKSRIFGHRHLYYDASQALPEQVDEILEKEEDEDSMYYFDACETPLDENEYPIVFTDTMEHPKLHVSFQDPSSLLQKEEMKDRFQQVDIHGDVQVDESEASDDALGRPRDRSQRLMRMVERPVEDTKKTLQRPRVTTPLQGYPGHLTPAELEQCQIFLEGIKRLGPAVGEQVYSLRAAEEEPYTICRWLRATKFDAAAILQRLEENQKQFEAARDKDFFPDISETIGAPFSVFLSQYPFLPVGRGKNGCPVNYFQAGKIQPEGIMSITTIDKLEGYFWWSFVHKFQQEIVQAKALDPDFVRAEGINIIDLKGLSSSALTSDAIDVVKLSSKISDFFPETLHCMLIINAPGFFTMFWGLIKTFIDPRTAQRIQVFSNSDKAMAALRKLVDEEEIPVDYGGTNKAIQQAFLDEAEDPCLLRQEIELCHVKRKSSVKFPTEVVIQKDEYLSMSVFTRSVSGAKVTILTDNGTIYMEKEARCTWSCQRVTMTSSLVAGGRGPDPHPTTICEKLLGPAKIEIVLEDLDNAPDHLDKKTASTRGYFLVVCDIKCDTKGLSTKDAQRKRHLLPDQ